LANIFVFHGAVDLPEVKPPYMEAELSQADLPAGFCYYAAGHIHERHIGKLKDGVLIYSGFTETVGYDEAKIAKGFYHVKVDEKGQVIPELIELTSPRKFIILEYDFSAMPSTKITEQAVQMVKEADEADAIIIPVLKGTLPAEASRSEVDVPKIRCAAQKALLVHPIVQLRETAVSDEVVRSIFEGDFKDLKTKAYEYFVQIFADRYGKEEAERVAHGALGLIEPLSRKQDEKVKEAIEELTK
jgi:DNA repair exonuclease SbcCD nuclease subunit